MFPASPSPPPSLPEAMIPTEASAKFSDHRQADRNASSYSSTGPDGSGAPTASRVTAVLLACCNGRQLRSPKSVIA